MNGMQKVVPSLWFDKDCEEAVNFYVTVFNGSPHKSRESRIFLCLVKFMKEVQWH